MTPARKTLLFTAASLTLASTACAPAADGGASAADTAPAAESAAGTPAPAGTYANGEYSASGSYIPPSNQTEEVDVTLTLTDGVVTALEVKTSGNNPGSKPYQREFSSGIQEQVVGKNIDELDVHKVVGSSLTSSGFNKALDAIRAEAAS